jgi:hypothetical protein
MSFNMPLALSMGLDGGMCYGEYDKVLYLAFAIALCRTLLTFVGSNWIPQTVPTRCGE